MGAFHDGMPHIAPVKDFNCIGLRSQRRQGLPERSRARRPALMAPVFAFGPSLCVETGLVPAAGPGFLVPLPLSSWERSMVPSGL